MPKNKYLENTKKFFKKNGTLSKNLKNYNYRDIQEKMSIDIADSINSKKDIIIEAGTGVGKTFAYLVPCLLSNKKVIISTGTKTLQEQLFKKDLPVINNLLDNPKQTTLLKGRRNYLCKYKLEQSLVDETFESEDLVRDLKKVVKWHNSTKTGDISEATNISEKSPIWGRVTIGKDGCLNKDCPYFKNCFVLDIKKKAQNSDIVIVNHHLLLSDWKLIKEDSAFLPKSDVVILDEAHQIPDLVHDYFGDFFSSIMIKDFYKELISFVKYNSIGIIGLDNLAVNVGSYVSEIYNILDGNNLNRNNLSTLRNNESLPKLLVNIKIEIEKLKIILESYKSESKEIESYLSRVIEMIQLLCKFISYFESTKIDESKIFWFEVFNKNFSFNITPVDISKEYNEIIQSLDSSIVYTSATISTNESFNYFINTLGLENRLGLKTRIYESPFDYKNQSILYAPRNLPNPDSETYTIELIEKVTPILKKTEGRAFFLFTSYKSLKIAADYLDDKYSSFNLLVQGDMNKADIIENFKIMENCILLGTSTFWEGVDIKGEDLQCVVIDKLPFASPFDPITQGKIRFLKSQGKDPFRELQCPKAAIALKQGAGRLIRDFNDYGVLVLADPRIITKEYGSIFVKSLPNMTRTREINKALDFIDI